MLTVPWQIKFVHSIIEWFVFLPCQPFFFLRAKQWVSHSHQPPAKINGWTSIAHKSLDSCRLLFKAWFFISRCCVNSTPFFFSCSLLSLIEVYHVHIFSCVFFLFLLYFFIRYLPSSRLSLFVLWSESSKL